MKRQGKLKFGSQHQILKRVINFLQGNAMTWGGQCNSLLDITSSKGTKIYRMQRKTLYLVGFAMKMRNPPSMYLQNALLCKYTDGRYFNASQPFLIHQTGQLIKQKSFLKYLLFGICLKMMNNAEITISHFSPQICGGKKKM